MNPTRKATNWDPIKPEPIFNDGRCVGFLQPRMTQEQLNASPGIQGWSRPAFDTRFPLKDFEIQVLCDDGVEHVTTVVDVKDLDEACDIAFNDALEAGWKPVQCEPID